eukprot:m51a1_g3381 hypothetical protein (495) ;mRNA; f:487681-489591
MAAPYAKISVTVLQARDLLSPREGERARADVYCVVKYKTRWAEEHTVKRTTDCAAATGSGAAVWADPECFVFDVPDKIEDRVKVIVYDRARRSKLGGDARLGAAIISTRFIAGEGWYPLLSKKSKRPKGDRQVKVAVRYTAPTPQPIPGTPYQTSCVYEMSEFAVADWGRVVNPFYAHHFIVLPRGHICHFYGSYAEAWSQLRHDGLKNTLRAAVNGTFFSGRIQRGSLAVIFRNAREGKARIEKVLVPQELRRSDQDVLRLARLLLSDDEAAVADLARLRGVNPDFATTFNFFTSNCENLACYLKTGEWRSSQIDSALKSILVRLGGSLEHADTIMSSIHSAVNRNPNAGVAKTLLRGVISARKAARSRSPSPASPRGLLVVPARPPVCSSAPLVGSSPSPEMRAARKPRPQRVSSWTAASPSSSRSSSAASSPMLSPSTSYASVPSPSPRSPNDDTSTGGSESSEFGWRVPVISISYARSHNASCQSLPDAL